MNRRILMAFFSLVIICSFALITNAFAGPKITPVYPDGIVPIAPYSPGMMHGHLLFIAGQIPYVNGAIPEDAKNDITEQTKIVMENLRKVLAEAGMTFANVLKATVYITDLTLYGDFNKVYGPYWTDYGLTPPARATVEVVGLPGSKDGSPVLVEISMIAGKT